jgi:phosphoglycerate kinase
MGLYENPRFCKGTRDIGEAITKVQLSLIGGGDTISAVKKSKIKGKFTHISSGGGAMLELLSGNDLVALR